MTNQSRGSYSSVLVSLAFLAFGPLMFLGQFIGWPAITYIGETGFALCALAMFVCWPVCAFGLLSGKYRQRSERDWKDQVW